MDNHCVTSWCRRVWMLFSLYYGVDLTRGFLNIALMLLEASVQVSGGGWACLSASVGDGRLCFTTRRWRLDDTGAYR